MTAFAFIAAFSIDRAEWKKEIGVWAQPLRGKGYESAPSSIESSLSEFINQTRFTLAQDAT